MPTKATSNSGQNDENAAKHRPVAAINSAAHCSSRTLPTRCDQAPTASVASAEPSSVAVETTPTAKVECPSASR